MSRETMTPFLVRVPAMVTGPRPVSLRAGARVRLASGGPLMTVVGFVDERRPTVRASWDGCGTGAVFPVASLRMDGAA